ncbi:hypothetical protein DWZ56_17590 [Lachnotalea sp. AF33-28]|nr:hypothetical protein DWZ56_17590 [Lachnotalea sp. AF33-28]
MIIMVAGMSSARKYTNEFALCSHISKFVCVLTYRAKPEREMKRSGIEPRTAELWETPLSPTHGGI